jgi:hypothetical protein
VTYRRVKSLMIGAVVGPIVTGCVSAFLVVPIMKASGGAGWFGAKGFCGLYWLLSTWWLPALLGVPLGAIIGLSRVEGRGSKAHGHQEEGYHGKDMMIDEI